jgi:acyl carrier protein
MTREELHSTVLRILATIAPEADLDHLKSELALRDQLDLDSVDFLNFIVALHKELHVEMPERDYPKLATLAGCVGYLADLMRDLR